MAGFVLVGYSAIRSARAARRAGIDPFTHEGQLLAQALAGRSQTLEQQLDDLHRRGVTSTEEHLAARARALQS